MKELQKKLNKLVQKDRNIYMLAEQMSSDNDGHNIFISTEDLSEIILKDNEIKIKFIELIKSDIDEESLQEQFECLFRSDKQTNAFYPDELSDDDESIYFSMEALAYGIKSDNNFKENLLGLL